MKWAFILSTAILCFALPYGISAQRALSGQRGLQVTAGTVNGLNPQDGFHVGVAFTQYSKHSNRWVFGVEYLEKRYPYKDIYIPQSQFTADAGYYLSFLSDRRKTFFFSIGASAVGGYETVNWNNKILYDGATVNNKDGFIYGGALSLEMEAYLTDRIVLLASARERFLAGSTVGKLNTLFGLGIKFIIN